MGSGFPWEMSKFSPQRRRWLRGLSFFFWHLQSMYPTRDLVTAKVRQTFPGKNPDDILAILDMYGEDPYETGRERVQLALLKLSDGNEDRLLDETQTAKIDFRDVIAPAEYPGFWKIGFVGAAELDAKGRRKLKQRDLRQYLSWLRNTGHHDMSGYQEELQDED